MIKKSVVEEMEQINLAMELISLGARLQLLESQTTLSRERLIKLYKELRGVSPPKGMLPFSTDWFLTWQPNIHASMFLNIHDFLVEYADVHGIHAVIKAYQIYLEQTGKGADDDPVLSLTRAWTLVRFVESKMLGLAPCSCCGGKFVVNNYDLHQDYRCGICHMPSRAGKTRREQPSSAIGG